LKPAWTPRTGSSRRRSRPCGLGLRRDQRAGDRQGRRLQRALIYYHFPDLPALLLAALDATSARRMARYRPVVEEVRTLRDLAREATRLFQEDIRSGDLTVLSEHGRRAQARQRRWRWR